MNIQLATLEDLPQIMSIIDSARAFLREQGLPQWQNGYGPNSEVMASDIRGGVCWVAIDEGKIVGTASLIPGIDPVYSAIQQGAWDGDDHYVSVHRFAVSGTSRGKGLGRKFLEDLVQQCFKLDYEDVRIDTYPANRPMIKVILETGFTFKGMVEFPIPDGERVAYQRLK